MCCLPLTSFCLSQLSIQFLLVWLTFTAPTYLSIAILYDLTNSIIALTSSSSKGLTHSLNRIVWVGLTFWRCFHSDQINSFRHSEWGVPQYDFYEFATILQVATIIFYYFILFLLILTCTPEQYTCTSINTFLTTFVLLDNIKLPNAHYII